MNEEAGYRSSMTAGGHWGWAAGIVFFALAIIPIAGARSHSDCSGCGDPDPRMVVAILAGVALTTATAFGFAARAILNWRERRRQAGGDGVEPPGLAISTATMLSIFLAIWCGGAIFG